jgi:pimeloyl-ACP methyl ester carboxylesterase
MTRARLLPGNDLPPAFYRPLVEALAARGVDLEVAAHEGASWDALVTRALDGAPRVLVGHSLGGLVALLAAARAPRALSHLVLLEPAVFPWRWLARAAGRRYVRAVVRGDRGRFENWNGLARRVADPTRYPPGAIALYLDERRRADPAVAEALFATMAEHHPLPTVDVPTLLLCGRETSRRARFLARRLRARLRPAAWIEIPGAAHWLVHEADGAVASAVAAFLAG